MRPSTLAALTALLPALLPTLLPGTAGAHMTLETDQAAAGSYWKAVLRVPNGCGGPATEAVEAVEATVPEGVIAVTAEVRWNEMAAAGQDPHGLDHPAPLLGVAAPAPTGHDVLAGAAGHGDMAGSATLGDLTIRGAVARASIGNAPTSAAYMTITTTGEPDRLIAASSPAAQAVELHTSLQEAGVSKMERLESVPVSADAPAELAPGGQHIMLIGLAEPLEDGENVPLTLTFEKAGEITLDVPVSKNVAAHAH